MFKIFLFFLVSTGVFCQIEASGKDDAKNAFHHLMEEIDKALTEAQKTLDKGVESFKAKASELEAAAKKGLDKLLDPLRKKLDDLVAKAKAKGFDVSKCQNYVDAFSHIPDDLVHNLVDCVNKQVEQAQHNVDEAITNAKKIEQDLNTLDGDIDKCGEEKKWKQVECYAKLIKKIAEDTKNAPKKILDDVKNTVKLISNLVPNLESCFAERVKDAGKAAEKDVADFAICAAV